MAHDPVVIVGASHAGFQLAASLRQAGFDGPVVLIGDEPVLPYQRPPLSKDYLDGKIGLDLLLMRPEAFYRDHRIEFLAGTRVEAIDRAAKEVRLAGGERLGYGHLVLATGARNRVPPLPGIELDGVCYLRTLAETDALRQRARRGRTGRRDRRRVHRPRICRGRARPRQGGPDRRADRPGHGACRRGADLAFLRRGAPEQRRRVQLRGAGGADCRTRWRGSGRVDHVELASGERLGADLVLVSVGVVPNGELAAAAGLAVANGIVVDEQLLTADPAISAIGDCASFPCRQARGAPTRLEAVQNAADHARCVADRIVGKPHPYTALPWFWSEQGKLRLQIAGLTTGHDRTVLRGDPESGAFSVFCYRDGALVGIESINRPADHAHARRILSAGREVTPDQAADESFDLRAAAAARSG